MSDLNQIEAALLAQGRWYVRGKREIGVRCPECSGGAWLAINGFRCLSEGCQRVASLDHYLAGKPIPKPAPGQRVPTPRSPKYRGSVQYRGKRWVARISDGGKTRHLGTHDSEEAARAAIERYFGRCD